MTKKNDDSSSWSLNEFFFDFKYAFFTLTPNEILDRFHVRLASEDDRYLYFELLPRKAKDKKALSWARLVLEKNTFLLKTFSFENHAWNTYEFEVKHLDLEPKFRPEELEPPTEATWKGWKFVR